MIRTESVMMITSVCVCVCLSVCVCVCVCVLQDNSVVLQSSAVAYVSLNSPVRGTETLRATASPTLLQLTSDIQRVSITAAASTTMTGNITTL